MHSLLLSLMTHLADAVDCVTGLLIAFAVCEAMVRTVRHGTAPPGRMSRGDEATRLRLGKWLALALEFALASDIVRTAAAPTWDEIGKLAAIMALRTMLNYFLEQEFERAEPEVLRAAA